MVQESDLKRSTMDAQGGEQGVKGVDRQEITEATSITDRGWEN